MRELDVIGVRMDAPTGSPILLLRESGGRRVLPIWIGAGEAAAIVQAMDGSVPPRPLTHDLLVDLLTTLGHDRLEGHITDMTEGTFLAELHVDGHVVQARPSDLAALAVRKDLTLLAPDQLLARVGIEIEEPAQDEVERFREFLDHVSPDDFDGPAEA